MTRASSLALMAVLAMPIATGACLGQPDRSFYGPSADGSVDVTVPSDASHVADTSADDGSTLDDGPASLDDGPASNDGSMSFDAMDDGGSDASGGDADSSLGTMGDAGADTSVAEGGTDSSTAEAGGGGEAGLDASSTDAGVDASPIDAGGCVFACGTTGAASATCGSSGCSYTCKTGFSNCDTQAPNTAGCECATPACCGNGCETTHSDGVGDSFYDCVASGTHSQAEAVAACSAFEASPAGKGAKCGSITFNCGSGGGGQTITAVTAGFFGDCWGYTGGTLPGQVFSCIYVCANATIGVWN